MADEAPVVTVPVIAVYGTKGGDFDATPDDAKCPDEGHWWHAFSNWWTYLKTIGQPTYVFVPFRDDEDFNWTGEVDGLWQRAWNWVTRKPVGPYTHRQWRAGGDALDYYIEAGTYWRRDPRRFMVVAHSHGGQVALYCAASGRLIPILITVSTPHRSDMIMVTKAAREHIGFWVHCYDPDSDVIGQGGAFGDGSISFNREQPLADVNLPLKGVSHSRALRDPELYHVWKDAVLPLISERLAGWGA